MPVEAYNLSPLLRLLVVGLLLGAGPLLWVYLRNRKATPTGRLQALTVVTLFLTFDLVLFGAFTRLSDSGLGCPDWPGCYGKATPLGAHAEISAAQSAMPQGPVTHSKAWIEMVHRYLASGVGVLIIALTVAAWLGRSSMPRPAMSPWWPSVTLLWVCLQGAFGALTVTMKLFPAIVTLHLLGGYGLLALLTGQAVLLSRANASPHSATQGEAAIPRGLRAWVVVALLMLLVQAASGAWVSTNYAVLACTDFPQCHGSWWPAMDFAKGFDVWRPLGLHQDGTLVSLESLTAIHFTHRMLALLTTVVLGLLAWRLLVLPGQSNLRKPALWLIGLLVLQVATGISNVVLGWPLLAALVHTGGAGALVVVLTWMLATTYFKRTLP